MSEIKIDQAAEWITNSVNAYVARLRLSDKIKVRTEVGDESLEVLVESHLFRSGIIGMRVAADGGVVQGHVPSIIAQGASQGIIDAMVARIEAGGDG